MSIAETAIENFLAAHGLAGARRIPLKSDASFRAYERLVKGDAAFVLMKAPPGKEDTRPFAALADYLTASGFSAPKVFARDYGAGLLLLEDLGDDVFTLLLKRSPEKEVTFYEAAVDLLVALHAAAPPSALPLPREKAHALKAYDEALLFQELALFSDWYLPAIEAKEPATIKAKLEARFRPLLADIRRHPEVLTLRDYHADNLIWLPRREGFKRVGLLDFQDAVVGHPAYDLVSLLQDARRPFDPALERRMLARYLAKAGRTKIPEDKFLAAYQVLGAQRNLKIIGIFTRLHRRDGKAAYPGMIPHVWTLLEANLADPALAGVGSLLARAAPKEMRRTPPG